MTNNLSTLIQQYLESLELGGKSPNTIRTYRKDLNKLQTYFNGKNLNELTVVDFQDFYRAQNFGKPTSLNGLIRSLLSFFNWLAFAEIIDNKHAFFKVRMGGKKSRFADVPKRNKVVLSPDEMRQLIDAGLNLQEKFMLAFMAHTLLRGGAVRNILVKDISGCKIKLIEKGDEEVNTYLTEELCQMMNQYLQERKSDSPYLFFAERGETSSNGKLSGVSINNRVRAAMRRSGLPEEKVKDFTAHSIRRSGITGLIITKGIHAAQMVANHKSVATTNIYDMSGDAVKRQILLGEA